ncbi:2-C-methyl-D-erythritol 4-phosphate cytidylyltransferase [Alicyclobacillus cellulosilyticus]|uniref:2-C-methyl-D-erythritol 4-phosphate cytidylyltransferase n=1 Tax=Alicyclobacillus cellulosilyticus TaxID=1003997 RepID=A0A917K7Q5_9BACL|nr:2-C-methyl-D-erythritol 4-phosphate cytidylyltransferase [Alicyclobacillus cellulosilyticus]GGJ01269.1 2-C-methyl-D-erythritol 4-phosphate cytidylyltransferase [Alicyclobacillus cellulosilyticus]
MVVGVVVAAGQGSRMGFRKQYGRLAGRPMWRWSVEALFRGGVERAVLVVPQDDLAALAAEVAPGWRDRLSLVAGGPTRACSVANGVRALLSLPGAVDGWIAVHDAARPFVSPDDVARVIAAARAHGGAILAEPCVDTMKRANDEGWIAETLPRASLWRAQTPQVFPGRWFQAALDSGAWDEMATDEAAVFERLGYPVRLVQATGVNVKVTTPADWAWATWWAEQGRGETPGRGESSCVWV